MPTYFIHLENALKRANEFIEVQNKNRALEILCDVLHSKKHRVWQKKHEEIMMKYLELCVELKQSYVAKEGIYQYKIICQQSYISSFEEVIRKYISMAEERANQAKEESQANLTDIEDLENAQTPQDILMSAVTNELNQDRKDRVVLIPWVKFLWESYRQCLDLLRHNNKTERLYHDIAHQAFKFCIKYNRKAEFRKLCDHLHLHLDQLKRQHPQQSAAQAANTINLNAPETQALHLETRLIQLDYAIQLELWQEAYKATDDIKKFNLMNLNKKGFGKPQLIASYYQKLSLVFWKASSNLFHAAAQFRLFHLSKDLRKNLSNEDVQKMATRLVLSVLSIPIPAIRPEIDKLVDTEENVIDQHHRNLSMLLGITSKPPTRASLIKDLKRMGVLPYASAPIQELYQLLEAEFNPLGICGRVQAIIDYIEKSTTGEKPTELPEIAQYIPVLKEVTIVRLIREVSQVYRSIEFDRLAELCPFANRVALEKYMVESARRHDLQVKIDHRLGCYIFGTALKVSTGDEVVEGPYLQSMPNEQMRRQLVSMYSSLQKALHLIEPDVIRKQREDLKRQLMKSYMMQAKDEHMRLLSRQNVIEKRKELIEQMGLEREMNERRKVEEEEARRRELVEARLAEETKQREARRQAKEEYELNKQVAMDQYKKMKDLMPDLKFDDMDEDELVKLKPQDFQQKRVEQLEKERRDAVKKQKKVERKVDHFERAKRVEELPLLQKQYEEWRVEDRKIWEICEQLRIEEDKKQREIALKERERFRRMQDDKVEFEGRVLKTRASEFEDRIAAFDRMLKEERVKRLIARREKRVEERRVRYQKEQEAKDLARQRELEEKQRARMAEVEEKMRLRQEELAKERGAAGAKLSADAEASGLWRRAPRVPTRDDEPPPLRGAAAAASSGVPPTRAPDEDDELPAILRRANRSQQASKKEANLAPLAPPPGAAEEPPSAGPGPRAEEPPRAPSKPESSWRKQKAEGDDGEGAEPSTRPGYGGRFSGNRGPPRDGDRDRGDRGDYPRRPGYGGRDSGPRGPPRDGDGEGPPSYRGRGSRGDGAPPREFGDRGDRDRYGGRDSGPRGPPRVGGDRETPGGNWRAARTNDENRPERTPYHGRDSNERRSRPLQSQQPSSPPDVGGGAGDDDEGWSKVEHGRKSAGPARGFGGGEGRRPGYGGRDSRGDRNEPPPNPTRRN